MTPPEKSNLDTRLDAYTASLAASPVARKRAAANWHLYAAVTGSAFAMATSASAGILYTAGPFTAGTHANVNHTSGTFTSLKAVPADGIAGGDFSVGILQQLSANGNLFGSAFVKQESRVAFAITATNHFLKKLHSGNKISTAVAAIWEAGNNRLATQSITHAAANSFGWAPNQTGFAAFRVETAGNQFDFGWVRLKYTLGTNGLANGVTALDLAYNDTGASINAGEGTPDAPEPSTTALGLLGLGAVGVATLRRRRQSVAA